MLADLLPPEVIGVVGETVDETEEDLLPVLLEGGPHLFVRDRELSLGVLEELRVLPQLEDDEYGTGYQGDGAEGVERLGQPGEIECQLVRPRSPYRARGGYKRTEER